MDWIMFQSRYDRNNQAQHTASTYLPCLVDEIIYEILQTADYWYNKWSTEGIISESLSALNKVLNVAARPHVWSAECHSLARKVCEDEYYKRPQPQPRSAAPPPQTQHRRISKLIPWEPPPLEDDNATKSARAVARRDAFVVAYAAQTPTDHLQTLCFSRWVAGGLRCERSFCNRPRCEDRC